MTWAPGGTRNRATYPRCMDCASTRNPHKARGLCTVCYLRNTVKARGRWPELLESCARCAVARDRASYGGRGLCTSCYKSEARRGRISQWPDRRYGQTLAAALVHRIGVAEVAALCNVAPATVRRWARGQRVPEHYAQRIATRLAAVTP